MSFFNTNADTVLEFGYQNSTFFEKYNNKFSNVNTRTLIIKLSKCGWKSGNLTEEKLNKTTTRLSARDDSIKNEVTCLQQEVI